eukprot:TRINITY_DN1433_c0_g1_i3.p1 TRINITY_DN1433_c0_g1~~TRINITY_DN1433_c0_g1_i3.p1  ORF type:complete len:675 (-),score=170.04 TRINITY_DN1433_c0_g1_i3:330-2312(-)
MAKSGRGLMSGTEERPVVPSLNGRPVTLTSFSKGEVMGERGVGGGGEGISHAITSQRRAAGLVAGVSKQLQWEIMCPCRNHRSLRVRSRAASSSSVKESEGFEITAVPTSPIEGQKTGTSGLRKKVKVFMQENYLANWIQSLLNTLPAEELTGALLVLGGDGRYFNKEAAQIIIKIAAANGVGKILVGRDGIMSTPAVSAVIRKQKALGGLIMSASHNPGGPENDWGIKFNYKSGEPAPETITDEIYKNTSTIKEIKMAKFADVNLSELGETKHGDFSVEVIDPVSDYLGLLREVFDFDALKALIARPDFRLVFDAMWAVTGAYARPIFVDALGAPETSLKHDTVLEDFGGGHPDPNLTYAKELVQIMFQDDAPDFGVASDGDGDRNMILGRNFFITPSDSVAIIAANAQACIPYFKNGVKGLARSMPTSGALDRVAEKQGLPFFEVPTGWKFFGNLMDAGKLSICGEESFGTGADHIREKDGIWAVLAWLSILAHRNKDVPVGQSLVSVADVAKSHWADYGRNFFSRYDYEECDADASNQMMDHLRGIIAKSTPGDKFGDGAYTLKLADDFKYVDPVDGSVASRQGLRFIFTDGSRIIFRLSGTGSAGATIRLYVEKYEPDASRHDLKAIEVLQPLTDIALGISKLTDFTGREEPTVIT